MRLTQISINSFFPRSNRFLVHIQKDLKLWLLCVVFLQAYRAFFIFSYHYKITDHSDRFAVLSVLGCGLLFDALVAGWCIALPFACSVLCGFVDRDKLTHRVRLRVGYLFVLSFMWLGVVNYGYFGEYHKPIDDQVFGMYYGDTWALWKTEWQDYPMTAYLLTFAVCSLAGIYGLRRFLAREFIPEGEIERLLSSPWKKNLAAVLIAALLIASFRAAFWCQPDLRRPFKVTHDEFLNQNVLNPHLFLWVSVLDHLYLTWFSAGLDDYLPDRDVVRAAQVAFSTTERFGNLDDYFRRTAAGVQTVPPRHIFLIIGESYDSWPLQEKYRSLDIMNNSRYFAKNGICWTHFLPGSFFTISSLGVILTGLPDSGKMINYHPSSSSPYPTAIAESFKRLGYRTRFFYGGYASWQKVGRFCSAQGFEEVITQADSFRTENPWGVDDATLFEQTLNSVGDDLPSFNVILMTNNHPPYRPLSFFQQKGFRRTDVPDIIRPFCDRTLDMRTIAGKWYTDACIGEFVRSMENKLPRTLFAITGDHFSRRFLNANPSLFERNAVPFVLYGKEVLGGMTAPPDMVGSHLDIAPTLIELCAPRGFAYYTLGQNLLSDKSVPIGIARNLAITPDYIVDFENGNCLFFRPNNTGTVPPLEMNRLKSLHDCLHGIAWWRVENGNSVE